MKELVVRTTIFIALVAIAVIAILCLATYSHAAECEPPPKLFFIWDIGPDQCAEVHHKRRHHHARVGQVRRDGASPGRTTGSIPATGATYRWKNPEHEKLFDEFERWRMFGSTR